MSVSLLKHNGAACRSAIELLRTTGKAAVIHPTGTGKSFIAFKLAEEHPDSRVLRLSPSEYIFRTQLENLRSAGGDELENVQFCTYAKLMLLSDEDLAEIHPDYIIPEEFHCCGAGKLGQCVARLLAMYANVPVLGLSVTSIRYLDNQRDMADGLDIIFDKHCRGHLDWQMAERTETHLPWETQRKVVDGGTNSATGSDRDGLTEEQIQKLSAIGMVWETDDGWETVFSHAKEYAAANRNAGIPSDYVCDDGYVLGQWWENQKGVYNGNRKYGSLSEDRVARLEALGMEWENHRERTWSDTYEAYKNYAENHTGDPTVHTKTNGIELREWVRVQREKYRAVSWIWENGDKHARLTAIGMKWE